MVAEDLQVRLEVVEVFPQVAVAQVDLDYLIQAAAVVAVAETPEVKAVTVALEL